MKQTIYDASVAGALGYLVPQADKPFNYMYSPPAGSPWQNCEYELRVCAIRNARHCKVDASLDTTGFALFDASTGVSDFYDPLQISSVYGPEVEAMAKELTGAKSVFVFDHLLRQREEGRPAMTFGRHGDGNSPAAVGRVHNDYTEASGRRRLNLVLPEAEADRPYLILNFWRPILYPALDTPLAICDARTFPAHDWIASDIIYPARKGEIYLAQYSNCHAWYYYPAMAPHEVLVFKTFDSRTDSVARMTPHCAFDDPTAPPDAPLRRSIEVRCLALLE